MKKDKLIGKVFGKAMVLVLIAVVIGGLPTTSNELAVNAAGSHLTYTVYATWEGSVGGTTANGHVIVSHDHFVALPSTKVLCSNGGHEYEVKITYNGKSVIAPVWDVGHWNTKDNYWDPPSQREMWQDLQQGKPEAQAAYQDGYNGGFDETNYLVKVSTGSDEFSVGDRVQPTVNGLKVRSTAGGAEIGSVLISDKGTVIGGPQKAILNGLYYRWWNITWDKGLSGWSAQKRYVSNPAGIDLADGTFWDDLGMTNNDWVTVEFLWTTAEDTTPPVVDAFSVIPSSVTSGNAFTISYTVSDTGGSGLGWIQLWRKYETASWEQVDSTTLSAMGNGPYSGSFYDTPLAVGTYWYGVHVGDDAGNWITEGGSGFSPIEVEVIAEDTVPPIVDAFTVTPGSVTLGDAFTIFYTVSDTGGSGLGWIQLWRKYETASWEQVDSTTLSAVGNGPYSSSFHNTPLTVGTYWYGIHVGDDAGNWITEGGSGFSPIEVEVIPATPTTIYVPNNYPTIQAAVNAANPGDTIIVRDGTYIENIDVNKDHLTIQSQNGAEATIVQAANPDDHVFEVSTDYVSVDGLTVKGASNLGMAGIKLWNTKNCNIMSNTLSNNYWGIWVFSGNNTITMNNLSENGIGLLLWSSRNNTIYLNNFLCNVENAYDDTHSGPTNLWNSVELITYQYNGTSFENYLGNYWDDYSGSDADSDGIGDSPYSLLGDDKDNYPLMEPFENYFGTLSAWASVKPTIDGVRSLGEWDDAATKSFTLTMTNGETHETTLYVKNDDTYLYLGFEVRDDDYNASDGLWVFFDNDDDGIRENGDDSFYVLPGFIAGGAQDEYLDMTLGRYACDVEDGGTNDVIGDSSHTNLGGIGDYTFEFKHPLDSSDDLHDFSLSLSDTVGFQIEFDDSFEGGAHWGAWPGLTTFANILISKSYYVPNPYGYHFGNRGVLEDNPHTPSDEGLTEDSKWTIFIDIFDLTGVDEATQDRWFHEISFGVGGNCYGMAASSLMEYEYPKYDQFLENQGENCIFELDEPSISRWCWPSYSNCQESDSGWDASGNILGRLILKHIIEFQISQWGIQQDEKIRGTENVLNTLRTEFPQEMYILDIYDEGSGHALIPFRIETVTEDEEYRVFVYDPNHPGEQGWAVTIEKDWLGVWHWEYDLGWVTWSGPSWWGIFGDTSVELIPISVAYNGGNRLRLPGTGDEEEATVFLSGEANLILTDSEGRTAGFIDDSFVEGIPNVELIFPIGILPDEQPEGCQPAFYISNDTELNFTIEPIDSEEQEFSLLKLGKGYLVEFQSSICGDDSMVDISADGTSLSVHGQNTEYNVLLGKNIDGISQTFTAMNIPSSPNSVHQYSIDWDALSQGEEGVTIQIDSDGDGEFEDTFTSDEELTQDEFMHETIPQLLKEDAISNLEVIEPTKKTARRLIDNSSWFINKSLVDRLWVDDFHLCSAAMAGAFVFDMEKLAVIKLKRAERIEPTIEDEIEVVIDKLTKADKLLCIIVINDAKSVEVKDPWKKKIVDREIARAEEQLEWAYKYLDKDMPAWAITYFRLSWMHAQKAIKVAQAELPSRW